MAATQVQCGVTNNRINREPIDSESVVYSYSNLADKLSARSGFIYGGLITSVINDEEKEKNGPWYISYNKDVLNSYTADRIVLQSENNTTIYAMLDKSKYTKPEISFDFYSPVKDDYIVAATDVITEEIEIGSYFTPKFKTIWPARTVSQIGTRMGITNLDPSKIDGNYLLGYSYGVNGNGIHYNYINSSGIETVGSSNKLDYEIAATKLTITDEKDYNVFSNLNVSYQKASYMYYQQLYDIKKYEYSYGEKNTAWFNEGTYISNAKYILKGRYRYYYGFSDTVPMSKEDLQKGYTHLLNPTSVETGTMTTMVVRKENSDKKVFWIAYPTNYGIVNFNDEFKIPITQPDGISFDLISGWQNMKRKILTFPLGSNNTDFVRDYYVVYSEMEFPIGNPSATISFKILPDEIIDYIINITFEDSSPWSPEEDIDKVFVKESSNNIIIDNEIW